MDDEVLERFKDVDAVLTQMEERLRSIARQNAALADMVEVLGGYVNQSLEYLTAHAADPDAHS